MQLGRPLYGVLQFLQFEPMHVHFKEIATRHILCKLVSPSALGLKDKSNFNLYGV